MADYPVQPQNAVGTDLMSMGGGNQMQSQQQQQQQQQQSRHILHQHMMGSQMQPQMLGVPMRGGPNQQYAHGMSPATGMIHARQQSPGNFRPQMMRAPIDQPRYAYVNAEHMHQMGMMAVGGSQQQQQQQSNMPQQSHGQQQQQMMPPPQMMSQPMQQQMVAMPMKMAPGQGPVPYNTGMPQGTVIHRQQGLPPGTFRQPLVRQAIDPRMTYMTAEQIHQMDRVRMQQNLMQHQQMQNVQSRMPMPPQQQNQPPPQMQQGTPSSSALRQALAYATNPVPTSTPSSVTTSSHVQTPTTPGGPISVGSTNSFGEPGSGGDQTLNRERQLSSSSTSDCKASLANVNPKMASEPVLTREALDHIVKSVDPHETLEDDVADAICVMMDEFIDDVIGEASRVARHRGGTRLEGRDVSYALEHFFDMPMSADGFYSGSQALAVRTRSVANDAHQQRMALIKKTLKKP